MAVGPGVTGGRVAVGALVAAGVSVGGAELGAAVMRTVAVGVADALALGDGVFVAWSTRAC